MDEAQRIKAEQFAALSQTLDDWVLTELELPIPSSPATNLELPEDLAALSLEELSGQITYWSRLLASASYKVSKLQYRAITQESEYTIHLELAASVGTGTPTARKQEAKQSTAAVKKLRALTLAKAELAVASALLKGYEASYAAVSREVSRRKIGYE